MCIDWTNDITIRPNYVTNLELLYMPCNYVHNMLGYTKDSVTPECIPDLEAQKTYLGPLKVPLYFNEEILITDSFGDESIRRFSKIIYTTINQERPQYYSFDLQTTHLEDETDLVQFGNVDESYITSPI